MVLTAENPEAQRSLLPTGAGITTFSISGVGPGQRPLPPVPDAVDGVFVLTDLTVGDWTVTVTAVAQGGSAVARGSAVVAVVAGVSSTASLALVPVAGQGWLSLESSWPPEQSVDAVTAAIIQGDGTQTTIPLVVEGSKAKLTDWPQPSGGFLLTLKFTKNQVSVAAPRMESVLVYSGKTTSGQFTLGSSDFDPAARARSILSFGFVSPAVVGVIDQAAHTVSLLVPASTNLTNLTPLITFSGASISPSSGTPGDFSTPRVYTVVAPDGEVSAYTVTVTRAGDQSIQAVGPVLVSVTLSGQVPVLVAGASMTVTATASESVDSRFWYLDAEPVPGATGESWTGGATLNPGPHSLMGVVSKNGLLFSSTCYFTVR